MNDLPVRAGYSRWAPLYDDDGNPLTALEGPTIRGWFGNIRGQSVLDLGCGTGRHTLALAEAGARVSALDWTPEMIQRARTKLQGHDVGWLLHRLPDPLPFTDSTFDLVVLGLVAEHVEPLSAVMAESHRVARPGARLLLSALHPDRTAQGQRARFIDPSTGTRSHIATIHRTVFDYRLAAESCGWTPVEERSLVVTAELAERWPRALPYLGQALGWAGCWSRS